MTPSLKCACSRAVGHDGHYCRRQQADQTVANLRPDQLRQPTVDSDGTATSWNRIDTLIALSVALFSVFAARTIISFDSFLYLESAESLFTSEFVSSYQWLREPGYPIFLRLVHDVLGDADVWLVAAQVTASVGGISLLFAAMFPKHSVPRRLGIVLAAGNPILIGYAGWIGQQILFMTIVCAVLATAIQAFRAEPGRWPSTTILGGILGAAAGLMSVLLAPLVGGIAFVLFTAGLRVRRSESIRGRHIATTGLAMGLMMLVTLGGWWAIKASVYDPSAASRPDAIWIWDHGGSPTTGDAFSRLPDKILGYAALTYDSTIVKDNISTHHRAFQLKVFGGILSPYNERCGYTFPGPSDGPSEDAGRYFVSTCRPTWATNTHNALGWPALQLYRLAMIAVLLSPVVALFRRDTRIAALTSALFLMPYVVSSGGPISRYAMPLYPVGIGLLLLWVSSAVPSRRPENHGRD